MPELPEVETLRQDLDKEVGGRKVKTVEVRAARVVRRHRNRPEFSDRLLGRKLGTTARLGDLLLVGLDGGPDTAALVIDLAATGRLLKQRSAAPVDRQTDAVLSFSVGGDLRVLDLGEAGELFLAGQDELAELADGRGGAIDPLAVGKLAPSQQLRILARR